MSPQDPKPKRTRLSPGVASILLFIGGILFIILNFTVLPIIGMVIAVLFMLAAISMVGKARKRMVYESVNRR